MANIKAIANAIAATIAETPDGAPAGILYAGVMAEIGLPTFDGILTLLDGAGLTRRSGDLLYPTEKLTDALASAKAQNRTV